MVPKSPGHLPSYGIILRSSFDCISLVEKQTDDDLMIRLDYPNFGREKTKMQTFLISEKILKR